MQLLKEFFPTEDRRFVATTRYDIPNVWKDIEGHVQSVLDRSNGEYLPSDVFTALIHSHMQLWLAVHGVNTVGILVTELVTYPAYRSCIIRMAAGVDAKEWISPLETVEAWAGNMGCRAMEIYGRKGWERVMKDYTQSHVVLRKQL